MKKERNSNYELLRIVSMFFIVLYHTILHGKVLENCVNPGLKSILEIVMLILVVHVNSYVLVSGYFQSTSEFKQSKLWSIITANWFYKNIITIVFLYLGLETLSKNVVFTNLFPLNLKGYWFINPYLIIYCLSPYLNKLINVLTQKEYKNLITILLVILSVFPYLTGNQVYSNDGFTLYNFVILYLIGGYIRKYPLRDSYIFKRMSDNLYQVVTIVIFIMCVIVNFAFKEAAETAIIDDSLFRTFGQYISTMTFKYSNPIIIVQSVMYLSFFGTLNLKSKFINYISRLTLGVYFIHDNDYVRATIYKFLKVENPIIDSYNIIIYVIAIAILIFIACLIIEAIRQLLFALISKLKIAKKIRESYYNYINNIKVLENT